jgi:hypothetical protein
MELADGDGCLEFPTGRLAHLALIVFACCSPCSKPAVAGCLPQPPVAERLATISPLVFSRKTDHHDSTSNSSHCDYPHGGS